MQFTTEQVLALAPDDSAASAARKLAQPTNWIAPGRNDAALWGECKGSALYQTRVDLSDLTAKCSCPSRKFPCKHSLGLMLLAAKDPALVPVAEPPPWVTEWIETRTRAAARKEQKQAEPPKPIDTVAQAKRSAQRLERVRDGIDALDFWMNDLIRKGLGSLEAGESPWAAQAARLVDAQAPALASRVRDLAGLPRTGTEWTADLVAEMGLVALLTQAFHRLEQLDPGLQADVRQLVGWSLKEDEIVAHGDLVEDDWVVVGQRIELDERFRSQRTWLVGVRSRREALVLQFAAGTATFGETFVPGTHGEAVLAFWPGAIPRRALVHERKGAVTPWEARLPGHWTIDAFLAQVANDLARQPWGRLRACVLCDVVPTRHADSWMLIDSAGKAVPVWHPDWWPVLAISGGHPIDVAGEWNGEMLSPLFASTAREPYTWSRGAA